MGTSTSELARRALSLLPLLLLLLRPTCVVSTEPLTFTVSPGAEGETPLQVRVARVCAKVVPEPHRSGGAWGREYMV